MLTKTSRAGLVKSLKKSGFYSASKPKRLGIIDKLTTKSQRVEMVDKLFLTKKLTKRGIK